MKVLNENFKIYFKGIKFFLMSELHQKIIFEYNGPAVDCEKYEDNNEVPSEYKDDVIDNDYTYIKLPKMKL